MVYSIHQNASLLNLEDSNLHIRYIDEFGNIPWEEEL